ncbi:MAG TPA: hypothetical protein DDX14_06035, partial [Cyanobacteria bacterium UBA9579]|nr:hypothetical protein [Cyanobacteria bacterium UBA9579]
MENDRRLRGADRGDGLKTFEMKSDTVDYFYNKYLITDAGAREMMRSYVKARLGEDFPEQSYWQSFTNIMAIGSGVDYGKNFELEELEANKNTARRWIATLLNDLNNQAKVRYAEMRARQQRAEFDKFVERFSMFENDLPRIIKEFQNQKKLAVEIKEYPKFLTQSQTERQRIETEYLKLKKTDISAKKKMLDTAWNWQLKCLTYSSRAIYMGEKQLGSFLAEERKNWISFRDRINNDLKITPNEVIQEAVSISSSNTDESAQIGQSYYNAYLSSMIVPFEWEYDPDLLVSEYLEALNAGKVLKIWDKLNNLERNLISHYGLIWIKVKEYINSNRSTPEEWVYPKDHPPFLKCVSVRYTDPQKSISCGVGHANSIASQAHNNSRDLQIAKMENVKKQIIEIKSVFDELTEARRKEYYQLLKGVQNNIKDLPYNLEGSSSNWEPQELETLKFELKNLKLSSGAGYYVDPPNANLGQLQSLIQTSIKADNNLIQHID